MPMVSVNNFTVPGESAQYRVSSSALFQSQYFISRRQLGDPQWEHLAVNGSWLKGDNIMFMNLMDADVKEWFPTSTSGVVENARAVYNTNQELIPENGLDEGEVEGQVAPAPKTSSTKGKKQAAVSQEDSIPYTSQAVIIEGTRFFLIRNPVISNGQMVGGEIVDEMVSASSLPEWKNKVREAMKAATAAALLNAFSQTQGGD